MKIKSLTSIGFLFIGLLCAEESFASVSVGLSNQTPYTVDILCNGVDTLISSGKMGRFVIGDKTSSAAVCLVSIGSDSKSKGDISSGLMSYQVLNNKITFSWSFSNRQDAQGLSVNYARINGHYWSASQNASTGLLSAYVTKDTIPDSPGSNYIYIPLTVS